MMTLLEFEQVQGAVVQIQKDEEKKMQQRKPK
jgi:hypothetical protein